MTPPRPQTIFVDVDDTLVRSVGRTRIPMAAVIADIRRLHAAGHALYLWSSGGAEYARASAEALGIAHCFLAFLPKPQAYLDDQPVADWRFCRHILPANSGDIE
ncbi:HAD family hydrolase [Eikenella sp. S3360]|uniref:HAD family hydrolase n=1 Tax=Eikenella glucosivorans TaxID=2766967 RepID=A0ABS0N8W0_9NEIS|nr:HAD family hydrolase [Eikenella glucosivorans]MBH5328712.1 HAD family hydrolase [Eikenella glucosivorans]